MWPFVLSERSAVNLPIDSLSVFGGEELVSLQWLWWCSCFQVMLIFGNPWIVLPFRSWPSCDSYPGVCSIHQGLSMMSETFAGFQLLHFSQRVFLNFESAHKTFRITEQPSLKWVSRKQSLIFWWTPIVFFFVTPNRTKCLKWDGSLLPGHVLCHLLGGSPQSARDKRAFWHVILFVLELIFGVLPTLTKFSHFTNSPKQREEKHSQSPNFSVKLSTTWTNDQMTD